MVSNLPELSLDLSPPVASTFIPALTFSDVEDLVKVNEFIDGLQNELAKIDAFKRELPLSFLLLNDAISKLKEEAKKKHDGERRAKEKFEEFPGLKLGIERKSWMSSAQLWSPRDEEDASGFTAREEDRVTGLSLVPPGRDVIEPGSMGPTTGAIFTGPVFHPTVDRTPRPPYHQTARKQRRCWSPDLHRRFVDALEQIGGSRVATPKQIRELMQVDGLTNDEVKSHLQKYRLHIRKLSSAGGSNPSSTHLSLSKDGAELGYSNVDLQNTNSPQGPLHLARSGKCNSTSVEDDEDEKSDGHSWKVHPHM